MKLIVLKNNLKSGLDSVGRAVGSGINLPILGSVLIKTEENQIKLLATNLELAIDKTVFGKVVETGSVAIPFNTLSSIVNNITSERINLDSDDKGNLNIQTDNYSATIQGSNEKDFPIIPQISQKEEFLEIDQDVLRTNLSRVVIAGEASDIRPEIAGVFFHFEEGVLKLVATDSFRLAEASLMDNSIKNTFKEDLEITVPLKTIQDFIRASSEDGGSVKIYSDNNQILFKAENMSLVSRVIDGKFPNYKAIIPDSIDTEVVLSREELVSALKLASSFASKSHDIKLKTRDKKIVEIYSSDDSVGKNNYLLPAKIDGELMEATFNWKYLLDGVKGGSTKDVYLGLNGSERPTVIKNPGDKQYIYILMPIKTD